MAGFFPADIALLHELVQQELPELIIKVVPERVEKNYEGSHDLAYSVFVCGTNPANNAQVFYFVISDARDTLASFISSDMSVTEFYRGQGIAQKLMRAKLEFARRLQCPRYIASVWIHNTVQQHVLQKSGWVNVFDSLWVRKIE